ncbi:DotI/IcmL/TraM family protein [Chromobacterium haemolyticum]|uniref:DotI/IcmL/TraM family protein n=1 Tax=Chromobacterium haemolyticum TaxID=394935 RepID=UPI00244D1F30|nr:VirB8/TrbF family protein [Chromobacterium haemolyticum]MDH0342002.1 VirB8/TrbF family protein [Chromobacterium haemolyticum]
MSKSRDDEVAISLSRLAFYKKHFGQMVIANMLATVVIGILVVGFVVVKNQRVEREYFAVDSQTGRMTPIVPLSEPYITQSALLNWAQSCVNDANTFDFANYQSQFQKNSQCFTPDGWEQFMVAIERAGTLETVKSQRLVASAVSAGALVITREGLRKGAYTWQIEYPITVTYQGGQAGRTTITQKMLVTLMVSRVPTYEKKEAVGIVQYVGQEKS